MSQYKRKFTLELHELTTTAYLHDTDDHTEQPAMI
jgi:hypothetical protein